MTKFRIRKIIDLVKMQQVNVECPENLLHGVS